MIDNLSYGTTNNKKKWCIKPLFVLLFMFVCFLCSIGSYNVYASSSNVYLVKNGAMVDISNSCISFAGTYGNILTSDPAGEYRLLCIVDSNVYNECKDYITNNDKIYLNSITFRTKSNGNFSVSNYEFTLIINSEETASTWANAHNTVFSIYFYLPNFSATVSCSDGFYYYGDVYEFFSSENLEIVSIDTTYDVIDTYTYNYYIGHGSATGTSHVYIDFTEKFKVTYLDKNSNLIYEEFVKSGGYSNIPDAPIIDGYDFIGWVPNISGVNVANSVSCDVVFTATYQIKTYSVQIVDYDNKILLSDTIEHGGIYNTTYVPSRVGYTFSGYTSDSGYVLGNPVYDNVVLVANYTINNYDIYFYDYNGSVIKHSILNYGSNISVPNSPSLYGYTFNGWLCNVEGYSTASVVDRDLSFTADYNLNEYVVNFYDYDSSLISSIMVCHGFKINNVDIPCLSRVGYTFINYSSNVEDINIDSIIYCNVDFTASYEIIPEFWEGVEYAKNENYQNGFNDGKASVDTSLSYNKGYSVGYENGYGAGYNQGENDGLNSDKTFGNLMYSIIDAPFNVLSNAFNFDIFGINLSYFLIAIVSLLLVFFVIRKLL